MLKPTTFCIFAIWLILSAILLYLSYGLYTYCQNSEKAIAHWPLAYTQYWPAKVEDQNSTLQSPLSTRQYSIIPLINLALIALFATLWPLNYLLSTKNGGIFADYACIPVYCLFSWIDESSTFYLAVINSRPRQWMINLQLTAIGLLLAGAAALSLVNLKILIPEQSAVGEAVYERHFSAVMKHYSFELADRGNHSSEPENRGPTKLEPQKALRVQLMQQLQRLQATHQCCGLTKGVLDFTTLEYDPVDPANSYRFVEVGPGNPNDKDSVRTTTQPSPEVPITTTTSRPPHYPEIVPASCCGRLDSRPKDDAPSKLIEAYWARERQWIRWLEDHPLANCSRWQVPSERNVGCQAKLTAAYLGPVEYYMGAFLRLYVCLAVLLAAFKLGPALKETTRSDKMKELNLDIESRSQQLPSN